MYCVKCGVKLSDGACACPLCGTRVMYHEDGGPPESVKYSDRYPAEERHAKYLILALVTSLMLSVGLVCLIICLKTFGRVYWSGYVLLGLALAWIVVILPCWFPRWHPLIFLPVDFAAVCGFLLYVCEYRGQDWFLSFAFPVTVIVGLLLVASIAVARHVRRGRLYIAAALVFATGGFCMLIELFEHITFGTKMFLWSLYCVSFFGLLGIFLLIAAIIPPLRATLERKFFI